VKNRRIAYRSIPSSLHQEVGRQLGDYSVAIAQLRQDDSATFRVLGSGTCVIRAGVYGILTAHHCLHACTPEITLGKGGADKLVFIARLGRTILVPQEKLVERILARPKNSQYGPDLTFIEIPLGPSLASLKAIVSFWRLDRNPHEVMRKYCIDRAYIANLGYLENRSETKIIGKQIQPNIVEYSAVGALLKGDIEHRGGWDYINSLCDFRAFPHLPSTFGGMSGGGIWAVLLKLKQDGQTEVHDFALVGVIFFQTEKRRNRRILRGHFVHSIYRHAWRRQSSQPQNPPATTPAKET
jgi:hypothetical protein